MRNPLYHWTHLELKRYFGIDLLLAPETAERIFEECSELLKTRIQRPHLLRKMHVKLVCTTEDPLDTLDWHQQIKQNGYEIHVHTAWRPDKALTAENPQHLNQWLNGLEKITDISINSYSSLLEALQNGMTDLPPPDAACRIMV